jgi:hypothetical protein
MSTTAHEETYRGCAIRLEYDSDPESPRDWDNLGRMVCWHRRYNLGDEQPSGDPSDYLLSLAQQAVSPNYPELLLRANAEKILAKHYVILDLYLYDHSGITMSTGPFSCPWDSGRVGFIYCSLDDARKNWMLPDSAGWDYMLDDWCDKSGKYIGAEQNRLPPDQRLKISLRDAAMRVLEGEVETYDAYLRGNVVGWIAEDPEGNEIHAVWGYYPDRSGDWPDAIDEAKLAIDGWHEEQDEESAERQHWAERDVQTVQ